MTASAVLLLAGAVVSCIGLVGQLCGGNRAVSATPGNDTSSALLASGKGRAVIRGSMLVGPVLVLLSLVTHLITSAR
jgi:hypothetical protein